MRRVIITMFILAAALGAAPSGVDAQGRPQTRQGFWIGFGLGGGSFGCEGCEDRETGGTAHLKLGGTLSPQLLLGADFSGWSKEVDGARLTHSNASVVAQFYPSAPSGFFLKGGLGVSVLEAELSGDGFSVSGNTEGLGLTAGLGFDIRLGTNFSLSPYANFNWGTFDDDAGDSVTANNAQLGLGATFH